MNKAKNMLIGEMLVEEGIITKEQLKDGLEEQKRTGLKIGEILIKMGYISKEILWTFLGYQMGVPFINLDEVHEIRPDVLKMIPEQLMRTEKLIPISKHGRIITLAMSDPMNYLVIDDLKSTTKSELDVRMAPAEDISKLINKILGFKEEETGAVARASVGDLDDILASPMGGSRNRQPQDAALNISRSIYGDEKPSQAQSHQQAPPAYNPPTTPQYTAPSSYQQPQAPQPAYQPPSFGGNYGQPAQQSQQQFQPQQQQQQPEPQQQQASSNMPPMGGAQSSVSQDTPVNVFLTTLLSNGYDAGATDIHIEPYADRCRIRRRIDGVLYEVESPPRTLYNGLLNKIKELAQMNATEKSVPQESKLKIRVSGREINMAVHTFPTLFGEKIVLTIVRADITVLTLDQSGMEDDMVAEYRKALKKPHGLILLSGPTNSGKETTLHSTLYEINDPGKNIFSVDDTSTNYIVPGINQAKVNRKNYGQVLTYLAEQDCDVITVGDIPNKETAEAVFDIIASGHLVIAKMRASDPYQALQTIINFGVEPYIVYSNTVLVMAQRLMRRICTTCRQSYQATPDMIKLLGGMEGKEVVLYKGNGCVTCASTGYKGRTAVFEALVMNDKIKDMLMAKEPLKNVKAENAKTNLKTLKEAALVKLIEGTTTLEEYMKIN
jgi:type II secretory ATPase GspE/PulE/Tfp pilus assembly ATPase PilB-like protein